MDARGLRANETVSASRKLGRDDAAKLLVGASRLIVAKGKKVAKWSIGATPEPDAIDAMLGPTGNLRAPSLVVGKTVLVGFDEEAYEDVLG
jgi:arsenate reductase-like glutaredoxin family protein